MNQTICGLVIGGGGKTISVLNNSENSWKIYKSNDFDWIMSSSISILECDEDGNIWIGGYAANPGGVAILRPDSTYTTFIPNKLYDGEEADMLAMKILGDNVWFGCYYTGIQYWNGPGFPQNDSTQYWNSFSGADGLSCYNFDVQGSDDYVDYFLQHVWMVYICMIFTGRNGSAIQTVLWKT